MPGRRSTGPLPLLSKPSTGKNSKRKKQRSLNALSIAEKTDPEHTKIRRHRLGESEPDGNVKRKCEVAQQDGPRDSGDEDELQHRSQPKRKKTKTSGGFGENVDFGSDSEGNGWMLGGVASEDDESLDSDEAMGESDEERFEGFVFRGSSSAGGQGKREKIRMGEEVPDAIDLSEGENGGEVDDDFGDEGMDMAAVLDAGSQDEEAEERDDGSEFGSFGSAEDGEGGISEDEESALSVSDDENDAQDSAKLASLKSLVTAMNEQDESQVPKLRVPDVNEANAPSEYGPSSKYKLTVADLLPSVTDPQLKKSLRILADDNKKSSSKRSGIAKKLDVPLPKRQQDRLDRAAAYEKSKETLNRWIDIVKQNRRAEHLSFPLQDPDAVNARNDNKLNRHTKPLTNPEATIQNILQDSGLAPANGKSEEEQIQAFEELEANKMPFEEVQARRAELRRARDLLFREEIRAKRVKKIKSKSYRRVHRKERERLMRKDKEALAAAGIEDSESEKERNDRRRAEERMGAKHRESRWAKEVKDSGRMAWDEDARSGVEEMARREEDLRKRILGKDLGGREEDESSEDDEENEDEASGDRNSRLQDRLRRLEEDQDIPEAGVRNSTSTLVSMKFMQAAEAGRKASNDAAVQQMQREMAGEETPSEEEPEESSGRRLYGPTQNAIQSTRPKVSKQRSEFEEGHAPEEEAEALVPPDEEELQIIVDGADAVKSTNKKGSVAGKEGRRKPQLSPTKTSRGIEENPWLSSGKPKSSARNRKVQDSYAPAIISNELPDTTASALSSNSRDKPVVKMPGKIKARPTPAAPTSASDDGVGNEEDEEEEDNAKGGFVLRNQDLVRRAFAGDDVVANFSKEKEEAIQSDDNKFIDTTLAGWGNWTGPGINKKSQQRKNKTRFLSKQEGIPRAKRQDAKLDKVIINEKRVKKNVKYLASQLPHPFETRQQYERSLRLPVGPEWTTKETFQAATKPRVLMKQGVIRPMAKPMI
ncbi:MAG: hypothetical protein Q9181_002479 [Wetmoreana brouardii]